MHYLAKIIFFKLDLIVNQEAGQLEMDNVSLSELIAYQI